MLATALVLDSLTCGMATRIVMAVRVVMDVEFVGSGTVIVLHVKHSGPGQTGIAIVGRHHILLEVSAIPVQEDAGIVQVVHVIVAELPTHCIIRAAINVIVLQISS